MGMLFSEFYGGKPNTPDFIPVNAQDVQQRTLAGNTAALPETIAQTKAINLANMDEIDRMLSFASGGVYARMREKNLSNINDLLNGGDITDVIRGTAAENLYRGVAGSGFGRATTLKNSVSAIMANKAAGGNSLERWFAGVNQAYKPVSVGEMFARNTYDLPTALKHATDERDKKFQRDYVANQWDWYDSFGQQMTRFDNSLTIMSSAIIGTAAGTASSMGGMGGMCWVAREVFGKSNPKWKQFREWLLTRAPEWFVNLYRAHGQSAAAFIHNKPALKFIIRHWMESQIATMKGAQHG